MTEDRMRRALGLGGAGARPTLTAKAVPPPQAGGGPGSVRRTPDSVGGGGTASSVPSALQQRVTELERKLTAERQKHEQARQLLQRAEFMVRTLETRFQHDALTQQEELDGERQATVRAQRALDEALFQVQQHTEVRRSGRASAQEQDGQTAANQPPRRAIQAELAPISAAKPAAAPSLPKKRGRPRTRSLPEPKPVRWWTPSYRTKGKG